MMKVMNLSIGHIMGLFYVKRYISIFREYKNFILLYVNLSLLPCEVAKKDFFQGACVYRCPKSSMSLLMNDIECHMLPPVDLKTKLVIIGDFNIMANDCTSHIVDFMKRTFKYEQLIKHPTTNSGSLIDMMFSNCPGFRQK